jgi:hypothetical protein
MSVTFVDVTGDLTPEFMVKYNMANIPAAASGYPSSTFTGYYFYEDSAAAAIASPADIHGHTTLTTNYIEWTLTISATKRALAYWKVSIKLNTTDPSAAKVDTINIPNVGNVGSAQLHYWYDSSYSYYEYIYGSGLLGDCAFLKVPASSASKFYFTSGIKTTLTANVTATITFYELDYTGNTVTDSDEVLLYT